MALISTRGKFFPGRIRNIGVLSSHTHTHGDSIYLLGQLSLQNKHLLSQKRYRTFKQTYAFSVDSVLALCTQITWADIDNDQTINNPCLLCCIICDILLYLEPPPYREANKYTCIQTNTCNEYLIHL